MTNIAVEYYKAVEAKDPEKAATYLHPDVVFVAPLSKVQGREAVVKGLEGFVKIFENFRMTCSFSDGKQAVITYELDCPQPVGVFPAAGLMDIQDGLIKRFELFYDPRPLLSSAS